MLIITYDTEGWHYIRHFLLYKKYYFKVKRLLSNCYFFKQKYNKNNHCCLQIYYLKGPYSAFYIIYKSRPSNIEKT